MTTFVEEIEDIVDALTDWAEEQVEIIVKVLSPSGRPYDQKSKTNQERISEYMLLRSNSQSWQDWINERANQIIQSLAASAVDQTLIEGIHPYDIALRYALDYSYRMERLINRYQNKQLGEVNGQEEKQEE